MVNFGEIGFSGKLRPSQVASSEIIREQLEAGEKNLHIVAPPGSGKTVLGLYTWSDLVRLPTLVLSPNSAIQAQWVARAKELFNFGKIPTEFRLRNQRGPFRACVESGDERRRERPSGFPRVIMAQVQCRGRMKC